LQRLASSILSNRPLSIEKIRELEEVPGVTNYEVCFAKLVDKLSNGTKLSINTTGTAVSMRPGFILGGEFEHECEGRSIGYFIEGILPLCLFAKRPVHITFTGATNDDIDICVDTLESVTFQMIKKFGIESAPRINVLQRGVGARAKGKVVFMCPIVRELKAVQLLDPGFVQKVRGVAYAIRVSPQFSNRMATSTRGVFNQLLPDVYINTDHIKNKELSQKSAPGYGISITARSTTGCVHGAKRSALGNRKNETEEIEDTKRRTHPGVTAILHPETLGENVAFQLLEEISRGGCIDTSHQPLFFMLMVLCPENVSKVRIGPLSPYSIEMLRLLKVAFGITFKVAVDTDNDTILCSCIGAGYRNLSRKVT